MIPIMSKKKIKIRVTMEFAVKKDKKKRKKSRLKDEQLTQTHEICLMAPYIAVWYSKEQMISIMYKANIKI